jgi:DNA-binding transcriptional LysR family regulator
LPKLVAQFSRDYPNVSVDIHFSDKSIDPIQEKLDFAIRGAFPQSSELIGYALWNYRRYMYAAPDYVERMGVPSEPEDLAAHDIIMHSAPRILRDWHFVSGERNVRYQVQPRFRFTSGIATFQAALEGAGIARLASWLAEPAVASGKLVRVCPAYRLTSSKEMDPSMHAVYGTSRMAKGARLFLEYVKKRGLEIPDERVG